MTARNWADFLGALEPADLAMDGSFMADNPLLRAEYARQLVSYVSAAAFLYFLADPDHPDWTPMFNQVHLTQPNPDDTYYWSPLRADGVYRVFGDRGKVHMLLFSVSCGLVGMSDPPGPPLGTFDLADMVVEDDGTFEVVFSAERPTGWSGNWCPLDPRAEYVFVRQRHYDWANEKGTRLAIEALHEVAPKPRMSAEEIWWTLDELALFPERSAKVWFAYNDRLRDQGVINRVEVASFSEMGGLGSKQVYWHGLFEITPGEALVLDMEMPTVCRYWNIQLNDLLFAALDYVYHCSHLNGFTATIAADGRFYAVLAAEDPGVPNWLDTADHYEGSIVGRWIESDAAPLPRIQRVPLTEVRRYLPANTPLVSPEQRSAELRHRAYGHQMRRRW